MSSSPATNTPQHLGHKHLSFSQVLASALGVMGISGAVVIMAPLIFSNAGNATCLALIIAMTAYCLVALQINVFARRIATVGSLYVYVQQGLGTIAGTIVGWALLIGYWGFIPVNIMVSYYLLIFVHEVTGLLPATPPLLDVLGLSVLVATLAWWLTYRGIQLSTKVILFIECITISLIAIVIGAYFINKGVSIDPAQLNLHGFEWSHFSLGLVLAMGCFTGFEASSVLGLEAKLPLKMIPRTNIITILLAGSALTISAYALVQSFHGLTPGLDKDTAPMVTLATSLGLSPLAPYIMGGVAFSWFGCLMGCLNTGSRLLYSLSRQGLFHKAAGRVHARHNTPNIAAGILAATGLGVVFVFLLNDIAVMDAINYLASFAAFGFLIAYIMVCAAALRYLHKRKNKQQAKRLKARRVLSACLAMGLMGFALEGSLYPVPEWPMNIPPLAFLSCLALALAYYAYLALRKSHHLHAADELSQME